jgi:hypothetical protein
MLKSVAEWVVTEALTVGEGESHGRITLVEMLKSVADWVDIEVRTASSGTSHGRTIKVVDCSNPVAVTLAVSELLEVIVRPIELPASIFEELIDAVQVKPLAA